ncbi:hypothetical protein DFH09DRAFT_1180492 [Mycena vulgaris]|nr:hypothetical protein DFH09DRAFT_1180492 [Mycena vulgaris]
MPLRRPYSYLPFYSFPDHLPPPSHYDSGLLPYTCQDISVPPQEHTPIPSSSLIDSILPYQSYNDSYPDPSENYKPPSLSLSLDHSPGSIILAPPSPSFANGKRPASSITNRTAKRARKNREEDRTAGKGKTYSYTERGARACNVCRRLKLRCVGADPDPPCQRCIAGNHHCIFEQSKRGNREKHEYAGESLRNVERTLGTVSRSIRKLGLVSPPLAEATYALPNTSSPSPVPSAQLNCGRPASPKSQQLPDSSLDPVVAWLGKTGPEVEAEPHLRGPVSAPSCNGPMENVDRNMPISTEEGVGSLPVNSILGDTFWDNMLMPGEKTVCGCAVTDIVIQDMEIIKGL